MFKQETFIKAYKVNNTFLAPEFNELILPEQTTRDAKDEEFNQTINDLNFKISSTLTIINDLENTIDIQLDNLLDILERDYKFFTGEKLVSSLNKISNLYKDEKLTLYEFKNNVNVFTEYDNEYYNATYFPSLKKQQLYHWVIHDEVKVYPYSIADEKYNISFINNDLNEYDTKVNYYSAVDFMFLTFNQLWKKTDLLKQQNILLMQALEEFEQINITSLEEKISKINNSVDVPKFKDLVNYAVENLDIVLKFNRLFSNQSKNKAKKIQDYNTDTIYISEEYYNYDMMITRKHTYLKNHFIDNPLIDKLTLQYRLCYSIRIENGEICLKEIGSTYNNVFVNDITSFTY